MRRRGYGCTRNEVSFFFALFAGLSESNAARLSLNMGGDFITEFLYVLLDRICFPYRDIDLARSYDWNVMEDLKNRLCTLTEVRLKSHTACPVLR
jgi:actin-related protein